MCHPTFQEPFNKTAQTHGYWNSGSDLEAFVYILALIFTSLLSQATMEILGPFIQLKQHPDFETFSPRRKIQWLCFTLTWKKILSLVDLQFDLHVTLQGLSRSGICGVPIHQHHTTGPTVNICCTSQPFAWLMRSCQDLYLDSSLQVPDMVSSLHFQHQNARHEVCASWGCHQGSVKS